MNSAKKDLAEWRKITEDGTTDRLIIVVHKDVKIRGRKKRGVRAAVWANEQLVDKADWHDRMESVKGVIEDVLYDFILEDGEE